MSDALSDEDPVRPVKVMLGVHLTYMGTLAFKLTVIVLTAQGLSDDWCTVVVSSVLGARMYMGWVRSVDPTSTDVHELVTHSVLMLRVAALFPVSWFTTAKLNACVAMARLLAGVRINPPSPWVKLGCL
jgi:hypothetical protein